MVNTTPYEGGFTDAAPDSARAFRAIMNVMARPGLIEPLKGTQPPEPLSTAAGTLILTLCDHATAVCLRGAHDCDAVRAWISFHTSAPFVAPEQADFVVGSWAAIAPLSPYKIGTPEYPDRSATMIIEMETLQPHGAQLRGPGIAEVAALNLPDVAALQANAAQFPLGVDCFFTCADRIAALPRSTKITDATPEVA